MRRAGRLLLICLLAAGCVSDEARRRQPAGPVTVIVTNHNVLDVTVFGVAGSQSQRLGIVSTSATESFQLPRGLFTASGLRLLIDPVGAAGGVLTDELQVAPGDTVSLTVMPILSASTTAVR
ncbi:MAG TPA: hypothetical protein VFP76_01155 [Gemmatimonadota bacterium]|nr:hypothetical protein [Gemmatimonadota bacterium]